MYVIRRKMQKTCSFKTYSGWTYPDKRGVLDLNEVQRFTKHEATVIKLPPNEQFLWYGCYNER